MLNVHNAIHTSRSYRALLLTLLGFVAPGCGEFVEPAPEDSETSESGLVARSLTNVGFESGLSPWVLDASTNLTVATAEKHGGAQSLRIGQDETALPHRIAQGIFGAAGASYSLSVWMKASDVTGRGCVASLGFRDGAGNLLGTRHETPLVTGTTEWRQLTVSRVAPAGTAVVYVRAECSSGRGAAWVDDVALTASAEPPPSPPPPPQGGGKALFETGYETGTLTGLRKHSTAGSTIEVVTSPVATGRYSGKYDLVRTVGQDTYRAETQLEDRTADFAFNTEYWFSMNYMHDNWAKDSSAEGAPFQIHRVPSAWKAGCGGEVSAYSVAPFLMLSKDDVASFITYGGVVSWSGPVIKNKWQNLVVHFKITFDKTGYVEAWKDGVKLFRRDGKLHEQIDDCGNPFQNTTFNVGIYKWDWKADSRQKSQSTRRTLYLDDIRIVQGTHL